MKKKIFGFDLGIASIGWSAVEFDNEYFNIDTGEVIEGRILGAGVRTFPVAENPKDGASLATPRREKRLARRICRRKARRLDGIKKMFIAKGLVTDLAELNHLFEAKKRTDVWDLRVEALYRQLSKDELLRVLIHLAKHRGFKSYRKAVEEKDEEGGKMLKAINTNKALLSENKTLAQIIVERAGKNGKKRNYKAKNEKGKEETFYINSIPRTEIERELNLIFQKQKEHGIFTEDLYSDFKHIAFRFKPISSVGDMVGYCSFEKNEKRAPKNTPSAELFVALSKINNLTVYEDNQKRFLDTDERLSLLQILKTTQKVKYSTIAKKVFKGKDIKFSDIDYSIKPNKKGEIKETNPEDKLFYEMKGWHKIKSILSDKEWEKYSQNIQLLDKVVTIIACEKNDEAISMALKNDLKLDNDIISQFIKLDFDKFINLSLKALYNILPYMHEGLTYDKACKACGYDFKDVTQIVEKGKAGLLLPIPQENQTTIPVINRTVSQFRKVYNAMVRRYGIPDQINIETGRELKKSFDERKKIEKKIQENEETRKEASEKLREKNINDNSTNILKWRLYQEQDGKCIYSGKPIDINRLDEIGYLEIDHILPYSRSLDNSYDNKVLCLSSENQKKSNKTPFEYLGGDWDEFSCRVRSMQAMRYSKKEKLLMQDYAHKELQFRERNANDNSYISTYVKKYLEDGVDFNLSTRKDIKNRVQMRSGFLTDYLRHCWGLKKDRNENDRHHAQDAIVIACATQGMVTYLSSVSHFLENKWFLTQQNGEAWYKSLKHKFNEPWTGFRADVAETLNNIFVSRPPRKNATGEIHQVTIRSFNPKHKNYNAKNLKSGIIVRGGLANNGAMLRTDVFAKKNKKGKDEFYLIPIYLSNMGKDLPNKAIVPHKEEKDWIILDDSFEFKFSLYMDDLIKLKKGDTSIIGYFKGTDRASASISIETHDRSSTYSGIGVKTQDSITKYHVDALGNISEIKKEKRLSLKHIKKYKE